MHKRQNELLLSYPVEIHHLVMHFFSVSDGQESMYIKGNRQLLQEEQAQASRVKRRMWSAAYLVSLVHFFQDDRHRRKPSCFLKRNLRCC